MRKSPWPDDAITPDEIKIRRRVLKAIHISIKRSYKQIRRIERREERRRQEKREQERDQKERDQSS